MQTERNLFSAQKLKSKGSHRGCIVALFGPDGTGKSTTASLLEERLHERGIETFRCHWRPRYLPTRISESEAASLDTSRPDEMPLRGFALSALLYLYTFLDFVLGYIFLFRPLLRKGTVIIYERYFHDILFHPRRYKLRPIRSLGMVLAKFVPSPHLFILLAGDPEIIHNRKPELPLAMISLQLEEMGHILPQFGRVVSIDTTLQIPSEIVDQTLKSISDSVG